MRKHKQKHRRKALYAQVVNWMAANDGGHFDVQKTAILGTVRMVADTYGKTPIAVATEVVRLRRLSQNQAVGPARVLSFFRDYVETHGHSPIVAEICEAVSASPRSVEHHIKVLIAEGAITKTPNIARGLRLVAPADDEHDA